jgi:alpha-glucuronidase
MPTKKFAFLATLALTITLHAQSADEAWLKYTSLKKPLSLPNRAEALSNSPVEQSAVAEIARGMRGLFGIAHPREGYGSVILGTQQEFQARGQHQGAAALTPDEYEISWAGAAPTRNVEITGGSDRAVLYGTFALLRQLATDQDISQLDLHSKPAFNIRWVDEWDNADGSIERGYAGRSIFFDAGHVREDLEPVAEYARLLASIGINGCNVNNVNGSSPFLQPEMIKGLAKIADTMRPYGVRLSISVDIASPQKIGGLSTYDPADPAVKAWWTDKVNEIYALIPDFAGFTVKADSEGQPGPASYGRTPADAANTLAAALAQHGGIVFYRAFVYNHHLDWNDPKADRARAAYDIFHPLDGKFAPNVVVQTKEGPIDFQAREPVSPLFGGLTQTSQAMEVQITQEYTGQQRHLVYLAPMWKQVLDFDMRVDGASTPVEEILARNGRGGMVGVAGVGQTAWLNSPLALANLYAFGRLAWDPGLSPEKIAEEWTRQTIGTDPVVVSTVIKMLMQSWPAYERYTGPLGLQTLTDITGSHYGPNVESSERNGWGQWHRADHNGVGMDRSVATGTGFAGQYPPEVARVYESAATTPDDLLLFFHHVPFTYKLHDGKTVIQYLYDSHYDGAAQAAELVREWDTLKGKIDPALYVGMRARLVYQAGHAIVWRDAIVQYFRRLTGIPDDQGRAGHYPNRLEAEDAQLTGYTVIDVTPWEDASGGRAIACGTAADTATQPGQNSAAPATNLTNTNSHGTSRIPGPCTAIWTYTGSAGKYDIAVQYFDLPGGTASFVLEVNHNTIGAWQAAAELPSRRPNGDNSTRITFPNVELNTGDEIRIVGTPDNAVQADHAVLDYIEVLPTSP